MDHLHPFKPLLFPKFSNFFAFMLGGQFLLPQRANTEKREFSQLFRNGCLYSTCANISDPAVTSLLCFVSPPLLSCSHKLDRGIGCYSNYISFVGANLPYCFHTITTTAFCTSFRQNGCSAATGYWLSLGWDSALSHLIFNCQADFTKLSSLSFAQPCNMVTRKNCPSAKIASMKEQVYSKSGTT